MSVYIKGMDMPKSCYKCPLRRRDGMDIVCPVAHERFSVADVNILDYHLDNCPLVPVPPHGDLIDRDAYEKLLRGLGSRDYRREKGTICDAIKFLHPHYAPTIIPADGKDTDVHTRKEEV